MSKKSTKWLALVSCAILTVGGLSAQSTPPSNSALLDTLVKKGVLTQAEADQVLKDSGGAGDAGDKVILDDYIKSLKIYGDIRMREEDRVAVKAGTQDHLELDRFRYRFRLGFLGDLNDNVSFGLRLDTNSNDRSSNVTFGTNNATGFGPFTKGDDGIFLNQIYVSYKPTDWVFTIGRMPLPLATTNMVWYQDFAVEGVNEQYKFSSGAIDAKLNFAQMLYGSPAANDSFGATPSSDDIWMLAWQASLKYKINATDFVQISPVWYNYIQPEQNGTGGGTGTANPPPFTGVFTAAAGQQQAINDLNVLEIPFEYDTMALAPKVVRFFGDFAYNFEGTGRADRFGRPDLKNQNLAYQLGIQYGKATKAGEWDAKVYWEQIDLFAIDPNLTDPDVTDSLTNLKGVALSGTYYLTNAVFLGALVADDMRVNNSTIAAGDSQDTKNPGVALSRYWLFQLDLNVKF